jgi:two-component system C4-dicarboxylate transport sensor histidine kinase DctB
MHFARQHAITIGKKLLMIRTNPGKFLPTLVTKAGRSSVKSPVTLRQWLDRRHLATAAAALATVAFVGWLVFELAFAAAINDAADLAHRRLALFDRTLEAIIERYHYLPEAIAQARESRAALENPQDPAAVDAANGFLSKLNETAGAGEIFLMEENGSVVAASNWWTLTSLVGTNYSFRPYFADAMEYGDAEYYAFGISTQVPGYFLSQRIDGPDGPMGVAVTKINLGEIEANWWRSGELIGILDVNEVAILSTRPDWRYRPLETIEPARVASVSSQQRYGERGIENVGIIADRWFSRGAEFAYIAGSDPEASGYFLLQELRLPKHGWRLMSFTPLAPLRAGALTAAAAAALGWTALLLIVVLLVQRQRSVAARLAEHDRLEQRVAQRTAELHAANQQLRAEIAERLRAEKARRNAQEGLVQAAKLASLGQALAGVAHEISQPVAALATHLASARLLAARSRDADTQDTLGAMERVISRLTALTGHLKTFARKESDISIVGDLAGIIGNALELADHKLRAFGIAVRFVPPAAPQMVRGNPIHIEQVLLNLFSNAADAMETSERREMTVDLTPDGEEVRVTVADTGEGIAEADLPNLFDPFFTTKEAGRGLGLGLSISYGLVRDMGGSITVESSPGRGTVFTLSLPLVETAVSKPRMEPA